MSTDPFAVISHRPWPLPSGPWIIRQSWVDLLFAHWPLPAAALRPLVPRYLELETHDGSAWIGVVPFLLTGFRPRVAPAVPGISTFAELNVRTYVRKHDRPGVFFFSLDASSRLAVIGARTFFHLPYHLARMSIDRADDEVRFASRRGAGSNCAELRASYRPTGPAAPPEPGSLDAFLTERYCLYAVSRRGNGYRVDIQHPPWPLQPAEAEIRRNTMIDVLGLRIRDAEPLLHFSARQDMVNWAPVRVWDRI